MTTMAENTRRGLAQRYREALEAPVTTVTTE